MDFIYIDSDLKMSDNELDLFASKNGYIVMREGVGSIYLVKYLDDYINIHQCDEYKSMRLKKSIKFVLRAFGTLIFKSSIFMLLFILLMYMKRNCVVKNNQFICSFK